MWPLQNPPEGDLAMYSSSTGCRCVHYHQISGRNHENDEMMWKDSTDEINDKYITHVLA